MGTLLILAVDFYHHRDGKTEACKKQGDLLKALGLQMGAASM